MKKIQFLFRLLILVVSLLEANVFGGSNAILVPYVPHTAPAHTIKFDMVEEFVCWFEEKGAKPVTIEVNL